MVFRQDKLIKKKPAILTSGFCSLCCCGVIGAIASIVVGVVYYCMSPPSPEELNNVVAVLNPLTKTYTDNRSYNDVCWLTSHNSFAYKNPTFIRQYFPNQILTIEQQLLFGIRSFSIDLHLNNANEVVIAHGDARLFEQPFLPFLITIRNWLDNNRNDIITIHFESQVNDYNRIIGIINNAGLGHYLFDLGRNRNWPTLGEMRKTDKRLVVFSDRRQDVGFGIMHASRYIETRFNLKDFPCCEMRNDNRAVVGTVYNFTPLFIMNHFYSIMITPSIPRIAGTSYFSATSDVNSYEKIHKRVCDCFRTTGKWPNFIMIDFVGAFGGNELRIVRDINERTLMCPSSITCP